MQLPLYSRYGKPVITGFILCSVSALPSYAAPSLHMYVFDDDAITSKSAPQSTASSDSGLKIHVFNHQSNTTNQKTGHVTDTVIHPTQIESSPPPPLLYKKAEAYIKTGYRRDELDWSVAGSSGTPNILSELQWRNIEMATVTIGSDFYIGDHWLANLEFTYGRIFDGENQDSDYLGDNRTQEFSRSNNNADEGDAYDLNASVAYRIPFNSNKQIELRPALGVSYHAQNLKAVDGYQTVSALPGFTPPVGPFEGLDSSYDATWFGPWVGVQTLFGQGNDLQLDLGLKYHYAFFDATANWNLRSDFAHPVSFEQKANGHGWTLEAGMLYELSPKLSVGLDFRYRDWIADRNGEDTIFFSDGNEQSADRLNNVNWRSFTANVELNYDF